MARGHQKRERTPPSTQSPCSLGGPPAPLASRTGQKDSVCGSCPGHHRDLCTEGPGRGPSAVGEWTRGTGPGRHCPTAALPTLCPRPTSSGWQQLSGTATWIFMLGDEPSCSLAPGAAGAFPSPGDRTPSSTQWAQLGPLWFPVNEMLLGSLCVARLLPSEPGPHSSGALTPVMGSSVLVLSLVSSVLGHYQQQQHPESLWTLLPARQGVLTAPRVIRAPCGPRRCRVQLGRIGLGSTCTRGTAGGGSRPGWMEWGRGCC